MYYENMLEECTSWWEGNNRFVIQLNYEFEEQNETVPEHIRTFWQVFQWNDNPWLIGPDSKVLKPSRYAAIKPCSLAELDIREETRGRYSFKIIHTGTGRHRQRTMCQWAAVIILQSPSELLLGNYRPQLKLRHAPEWLARHTWKIDEAGIIHGTPSKLDPERWKITCSQQQNGVTWDITGSSLTETEKQKLQKWSETEGVVFKSHPQMHEFPWEVDDRIANRNAVKDLKRQVFAKYNKEMRGAVRSVLERLEVQAQTDRWQRGLQQQTPQQLWIHDDAITPYQIWVVYRIVLRQLNLYNEGRQDDSTCRRCQLGKETQTHIFWECPHAKECWLWLISHWLGVPASESELPRFRDYCASRKAPPISTTMKMRLKLDTGSYTSQFEEVLQRIWRVLTTVCYTVLWVQRNRKIFEEESMSVEQSCYDFQEAGIRQLRAVAKREEMLPETVKKGVLLSQCLDSFTKLPEQQPRESVAAMRLARQSPLVAMIKTKLGF